LKAFNANDMPHATLSYSAFFSPHTIALKTELCFRKRFRIP